MDIAEYFKSLTVSEDLFKDVKFFVTGRVSEEVLKLLTDGGAKQEAHITDYMTHLIVGEEPDDNEIGEVKDIYEKPVVTQRWVLLSTKCGRQLPSAAFTHDANQLFSGVRACVSQLGREDALMVWAMLTFFGGQFCLKLDLNCTHLIVGKPEGAKYKCALDNEDVITPVTPDWVMDCIDEASKLDEGEYHPRLLRLPRSQAHLAQPSRTRSARKKEKKAEQAVKEEPRKKELEKETKSLFDTLEFSDDDDDNGKAGGSLLDQLKTSQMWRQPITKPTVTTRSSAASQEKPKTPLTAPLPTTTTATTTTSQPTTAPVLTQPPSSPVKATDKRKMPLTAPLPTTTTTTTATTKPTTSQPTTTPVLTQPSSPVKSVAHPPTPATTTSSQTTIAPPPQPSIASTTTSIASPSDSSQSGNGGTESLQPQPPPPPSTSATTSTPQTAGLPTTPQATTTTTTTSTAPVLGSVVESASQPTTAASQEAAPTPPPQSVAPRVIGPAPRLVGPSSIRPAPVVVARTGPSGVTRIAAPMSAYRGTSPNTSRATPPISSRATPPIPSRATPPITHAMPQAPPHGTPPITPAATPCLHAVPQTSRATPPVPPVSTHATPPTTHAPAPACAHGTPPTPSHATHAASTPPMTHPTSTPPVPHSTPLATLGTPTPPLTRTTPTPQGVPQIPVRATPTAPPALGRGTALTRAVIPTGARTLVSAPGARVPTMPLTMPSPSVRAPGAVQSQGAPSAIPGPSMATPLPQQQVHTVAIPGAVVRLPQGVTPQQLQMMTPSERHSFLQNLHQKQLQEQQSRGKPRAGKPPGPQYKVGVRYAAPGLQGPGTAGTPATWSGPGQAGAPVRAMTTVAVTYPAGQIPAQAGGPSGGAPSEGVRPGWPGQQQGQQQQQPQQQYPPGQAPPPRLVVAQPAWQQQQQQQQAIRAPAPGQQGAAPQGLLPQHMQQFQQQIQQLCHHFPHLTHQEASQLIQRIPAHYRQIQQLDNAQRNEYLAQLDSKEKQVVTFFIVKKQQQQIQQRQQLLQQQHQQQQKVGTPQQSPHAWQHQPQQGGQYPPVSPHARPVPGRPVPQGYPGCQPSGVVSPGQGSPHMVASGQLTPQQQLTPHVSPLASPHGHSPIQRPDGTIVGHPGALQGSPVPQNLVNQQNLVNPKTKTALAIHLTNRLAGGVHQGAVLPPGAQPPQGSQPPVEVPPHVVQKPGIPQEAVQGGGGGESVIMYQRRALGNITGTVTNNLVRPAVPGGPAVAVVGPHGYPRPAPPPHPSAPTPVMAPATPHYPRPHLVGHDTNIMLPRELCLVGCVFYIADYHGEVTVDTLHAWKRVIQQHGGEVVPLYDSHRVTHLLCKHQKSPVFMQAVRDNKRCITIFWLNDVLLRGKMAPPWQAIHLPTPFGNDNKPCKDLIISLSGFENEERMIIKLMLHLVGAKYTGYFSKQNSLLICKKLEGAKVSKAREWKRPVVNGVWLSEVLLGQNTPPLVYHGTRYQHYLDDPLRIDPSLASHLFNAWKYPISVSKESVEKAKAVREMALRKRKTDGEGDQENKRSRLEPPPAPHLSAAPTPTVPPPQPQLPLLPNNNSGLNQQQQQQQPSSQQAALPAGLPRASLTLINKDPPPDHLMPRILLSYVKNREAVERKVLELGGYLAESSLDATHLVMGAKTAQRTVKFMCAISSCRYVLSIHWLLQSHAQAKFLPEESFILDMPEYERVFKFSLKETLQKPNRRQFLLGKTFYLTPTVVPGRTWLRQIIECAGGSVENKRSTLKDIKEKNKDGQYNYVAIATEADEHLVKDLLGEKLPVHTAEYILGAILRQELSHEVAPYVPED